MGDGSRKRIDEVEIGDAVLSSYGSGDHRPARVLRVHRAEAFGGVEIALASGRRIISTADHVHFAGFRGQEDRRFSVVSMPTLELRGDVATITAVAERVESISAVPLLCRGTARKRRHRTAVHCCRFGATGHGDGRRGRRVRPRRVGRVGRARRTGLRPRCRTHAQLRCERHRHAQLDLQIPRGRLPESRQVRGCVPGSDDGRARPELPLDATHPRRRQRGHREQRRAPDEAPLDRQGRRRADRPLPGRRRARRSRVRRRARSTSSSTTRITATATSPSSTAPTCRAACSRSRSCAPASRTACSAA